MYSREDPDAHVIVEVLNRFGTPVVLRVVGHAPTMAVSGTTPWTIASFASCTREPIHALASARLAIALATVGALHAAVGGVRGRCLVAPG